MTNDLLKCGMIDCELKKLVNNFDEIVVLQNSSGEYIYINKIARSLLKKYLKEDMYVGKKPEDIFSEKDTNKIYNQLKKVIKTKKKIEVENWFTIENQRYCFKELIFPVVVEENKKIIGKIGKDITKEKRLKKSLTDSESNFQKLIQNLPCGVIIIQDEILKVTNRAFEVVTEYNQSELKTMNKLLKIISPNYKDLVYNNYLKKVKGNKDYSRYNIEIKTKKGKNKSLQLFSIKINYKNKPASLAAFFDITEMKILEKKLIQERNNLRQKVEEKTLFLKKSKEKLEQSNRYLDDLINSTSDIIIAFDKIKNLKIWNKKIESITGIKKDNILGKNLSKLNVIESKKAIDDCLKNDKTNTNVELIVRCKHGEKRIIKTTCNIIKDKDDCYNGLLLVGRDITDIEKIFPFLIPGKSYLVTPENKQISKNLIKNMIDAGYSTFFVSRGKTNISTYLDKQNIFSFQWGEEHKDDDIIHSLNDFYYKLKNHLNNNPKSIVYIERIDYFLINERFSDIMNVFFKINNILSKTDSFLFLDVQPALLTEKEFEYIKQEFLSIPLDSYLSCNLLPHEMKILRYINEMNIKNVLVSYKDVKRQFSMVSQTTANRLEKMKNKGVINIVKNGKRKNLFISSKGKLILSQKNTKINGN